MGVRTDGGERVADTYRQGLHHEDCWSRPKRARHFFKEPGSVATIAEISG